jgi:hypothetical protein
MRFSRILSLAAALLAVVIVVFLTSNLMRDRFNSDMQAEKALRVLRPRVQQFANDSGRVPRALDELQPSAIIDALCKQIDRAGYDLIWLRRDEHYGLLIARLRTATDVAKAYVAIVAVQGTADGGAPPTTSPSASPARISR